MKDKLVKKYQMAQIELLELTDKICSELNIHYYMIGGTLLGAIRHKGFIPWDADIDIAMRRDDYELFRNYWNENQSEKYVYQHYSTEKNHLSPHAILRIKDTHVVYKERRVDKFIPQYDGIYLDIFPLDDAPLEPKKQNVQMRNIKRIKRVIDLKIARTYGSQTGPLKRVAKKVVQFLLSPFSLQFLYEKLDDEMKKYNGSGSGYIVSMASHYSYKKQYMPVGIYGQPIRVSFEDHQFCAPEKTDDYLRQLFGDYMKLPPENERYSELDAIEGIDYGSEFDKW